jgi:hypothetical protein
MLADAAGYAEGFKKGTRQQFQGLKSRDGNCPKRLK